MYSPTEYDVEYDWQEAADVMYAVYGASMEVGDVFAAGEGHIIIEAAAVCVAHDTAKSKYPLCKRSDDIESQSFGSGPLRRLRLRLQSWLERKEQT